jgi:hypothetical protein
MLVMDRQLAQGSVAILGGSAPSSNAAASKPAVVGMPTDLLIDESAVTLGFLALTEGNTVDACFGVSSISNKDARGKMMAKEVKQRLVAAADSNDAIRRLAVLTYQQAFRTVVGFHHEAKKLNCFTRCFCYGKLQRKTLARLKENFAHLEEAVHAVL